MTVFFRGTRRACGTACFVRGGGGALRLMVQWLLVQVVAFAGGAASADQGNETSFLAATEALLAVLPAWLAAGRSASEAAAAVVEAALKLPLHRQLPILRAVHAALPVVKPPPPYIQQIWWLPYWCIFCDASLATLPG